MARTPVDIASLDLESLNDGQLRELVRHVKEAQRERFTSRFEEFRVLAREAGYELTVTKAGDGDARRRRGSESAETDDRRGQVRPKYQNPDNHSEKWSGRGRKPKWVEDKLTSGKKLDDLLIRPEPAVAAD